MWTTIRTFAALGRVRIVKKFALLLVILSLALLSVGAGARIGSSYFSQGDFQLSLGLVVLDDDPSMDQITQLVLSTPELREYYNFVLLDSQQEGISQVEQNQIYACIVLPEDFLYSLQTGQNYPPLVILNSTQAADALLTSALCDVLSEMMRLTQSGIYTATDQVVTADALDTSFYLESNLVYLTQILDRSETFLSTDLPYEQVLDLGDHYALSLAVYLLLLSTALFYDILNVRRDFPTMKGLAARSRHHHTLYFTQLAVIYALYLLLFLAIVVVLGGALTPLTLLSLCNATALFLLGQALLFQLVPHPLPAMVLSLSLHTLALVCAGGVVPTLLLPQLLSELSPLFPLTHIRTLLSSGLVTISRLPLLNLIVLAANWLLCALLCNFNDKILTERGAYDGIL